MEGDPSKKQALKAKKGGTRNYLRMQMHGLFVKPIICNKLIKYIMIASNSHPYKRQHPSNMRMLLGATTAMAIMVTSAASAN